MRQHVHRWVHRLETDERLDRPAGASSGRLRRVLRKRGRLRTVLTGAWFGHPLHPPLTDAVIGAWVFAAVLDVALGGGAETAVRVLMVVGLVAWLPTAASGAAEWFDTQTPARRVGLVHAALNSVTCLLVLASLLARLFGPDLVGTVLLAVAAGAQATAAFLGGHLSFRLGLGVDHTAFDAPPRGWRDVAALEELAEGRPRRVLLGETPLLVVREGTDVHVLADRCSHAGTSLCDGWVGGGAVRCAQHGSVFRLTDGRVLRGPATAPQPTYEVRVQDGRVEVRAPERARVA